MALAHVDHRWRPESVAEAQAIEAMAARLGLRFHLKTLDPKETVGNPEAFCRQSRLDFFTSLCHKHGYEAVLLAHHADDHAETVVKRVFEGAALVNLGGLKPVTVVDGLPLWRPLLRVTKKEILAWLEHRALAGFNDATNEDCRFLRGRLRKNILPYLSEAFGKEIAQGLCHLGREALEIQEFLDEMISPYLASIMLEENTALLDLSKKRPASKVELKHLIRRFSERHGMPLSRESLALAADFVLEDAPGKLIEAGAGSAKKTLGISRRKLKLTVDGECVM